MCLLSNTGMSGCVSSARIDLCLSPIVEKLSLYFLAISPPCPHFLCRRSLTSCVYALLPLPTMSSSPIGDKLFLYFFCQLPTTLPASLVSLLVFSLLVFSPPPPPPPHVFSFLFLSAAASVTTGQARRNLGQV